jgi:hypothetical protein
MEVTFYDYLATKVPNDCYAILCMDGKDVPRPRDAKHLAQMLKQYIRLYGKEGLDKLAQVHPDKELIMNADRPVKDSDFGINTIVQDPNVQKDFSNFCPGCSLGFDGDGYGYGANKKGCSCGGKCGSKKNNEEYNNADGGDTKQSKAHEIIFAAGILLIATAFIISAVKK